MKSSVAMMRRILREPYVKIKVSLALHKIRLKRGVIIGRGTKIDLFTKTEENVVVGQNCNIRSAFLGFGTYLSDYASLIHTSVGRFCAIADNVRSGSGTHPSKTFVSIHPAFFSTNRQAGFSFVDENKFDEMPKVNGSQFAVEIGNDVWIGSGVRINNGVCIGDGAIIGAGAVVTNDIEPYSINVGIPARKIRYRFSAEQIDFLLNFRWWDRDIVWLKQNAAAFDDIDNFCEKFSRKPE